MALPTRIFLAASMLLVAAWGWYSTLSADRVLRYRQDAIHRLSHRGDRGGVLRGRVALKGLEEIPSGSLFLKVRACAAEGEFAMEDSVAVEASGRFECFGLPIGTADLSVELGAGEVVWEARDVAVDSIGATDPRLDPIDLGGRVVPIVLSLLGPDDRPVETGRVAWRRTAGLTEDVVFGSVVPVSDGRALFLATDDVVDAVALVPGAEPEVFEGVGDGSELMLGPGTTVVVRAHGPRPDPERWNVHVLLHPLELDPTFEVLGAASSELKGTLAAVLDAEGSAEIPITFPGRYDVRWYAEEARRGVIRSYPLDGGHDPVDLTADSGWVEIDVEFPLDEFVRAQASRRR
ncbi:MAG: hypothetical protein VXZ39_13930 [Planctomycetota bacterium]|nr:hypothetical protein [Planctomycetota bacterium]MEC8511653.1 hypothetical protein [Planctomycetota bacterium]